MKLDPIKPTAGYLAARISSMPETLSSLSGKSELFQSLEKYYLDKNFDLIKIGDAIEELNRASLNTEQLRVFDGALKHWMENGSNINELVRGFARLVSKGANVFALNLYSTKVSEYKNGPLVLDLTLKLEDVIKAGASPKLLSLFQDLLDYHLFFGKSTLKVVDAFKKSAKANPDDKLVENLDSEIKNHMKSKPGSISSVNKILDLMSSSTSEQLQFYFDLRKRFVMAGKVSDDFLDCFLETVSLNLSESYWKEFKDSAERFAYRPWVLEAFIDSFNKIIKANRNVSIDLIKDFNETVLYLKDNQSMNNLSDLYAPIYVDLAKNNYEKDDFGPITKYVLRNDNKAVSSEDPFKALNQLFKKNLSKNAFKVISDFVVCLNDKKLDVAKGLYFVNEFFKHSGFAEIPIAAFVKKLKNNQIPNSEISSSLNTINSYLLLRALIRREGNLEEIRTDLSRVMHSDSMPVFRNRFGSDNLERRMFSESELILRDAYDMHEGFGSLTFESRRSFDRESCLMARFGNDVGKSEYVYAEDINKFPGRGIILSSVDPRRIFASDKQNSENPFQIWTDSLKIKPYLFEDLSSAEFLFTRGLIAVLCPENNRYAIDGVNYSYVVLNNHFLTSGTDVAFLVPTQVLKEKLSGTTISFEDGSTAKKANTKDVNNEKMAISELIKGSLDLGLDVLNVGWASNLGGGLCNAYPPKSSPHFEWERDLDNVHSRDIFGHYHKAHIIDYSDMSELENTIQSYIYSDHTMNTVFDDTLGGTYEKKFTLLRVAHHNVFTVTKNFQDLLLLQKISLAMWHKGQTFGKGIEVFRGEEMGDSESIQANAPTDSELLFDDSISLSKNSKSVRMLRECYRWNQGRNATDDKSRFPLLLIASAEKYSDKPSSEIVLDTYDMTLFVNEDGDKKIIPFNPNEIGEIELGAWKRYVMEKVESDIWKDLRFYSREAVGL